MRSCFLLTSAAWVMLGLLISQTRADYKQEVLKDQPVAWWRFQDSNSTDKSLAQDEMARHPAGYHGGVTLASGVPGIGGRAAQFNGTTAYLEVPHQKELALEAVSVEFWFRSSQPWNAPFWPGSAALIACNTPGSGSGDWTIIAGSSKQDGRKGGLIVGVGPKSGADVLLESPGQLNDDQWHHAVWTRSAEGLNCLFIDGGLVATAQDDGGTISARRPLQIGGDPFDKGKFFSGSIAEVALYKHPLVEERIKAHTLAGGIKPQANRVSIPVPQAYAASLPPPKAVILQPGRLRQYVETFNKKDRETTVNAIPNSSAEAWLTQNVPLLECPDKDIEEIYYFRWWVYRKHIKKTPAGHVITEFLPPVGWAGKFNTISCAAGHHIYEGRWLYDPCYMDDYRTFWFRGGGQPRRYSFWAADACWARYLIDQNKDLLIDLLPELEANYQAWEKSHQDPNGLFWQIDDRDGMEVSIGGSGYRATINSYMYGDACAISRIASLAGKKELAEKYQQKAERIKQLTQEKLWDAGAGFFKVAPRGEVIRLADVRELHGYTPWYFNLPDAPYSVAWKQLMDKQGFFAPFGPTTAERRHPRFMFKNSHDCLWNGPSWPYATAVTLTALANLLNNYQQEFIGKKDYLELLKIYARSQHLKLPEGETVPWIDEDLHPDTGEWLAREILRTRGTKDRGKDYNHSSFCDLVISGLVGLRPREGDVVEVNPLVPDGTWDYFCLDQVRYHDRWLTIVFDRTGEKYGKGKGLKIFSDGQLVAGAETIQPVKAKLPPVAVSLKPFLSASQSSQPVAGWVKYQDNPVLGGKYGTCFDIAVLKDGDIYRMWFSWRPKKSIALVESSDGLHWSEPQIVLGPNAQTDWETDLNRPGVIKKDNVYHMWYTGQARGRSWIGYATSKDGKNWQRQSDKPVLSAEKAWEKVAVMCPHVLWDEDQKLYRMWYSGGGQYEPDAIGHATSPDGLHWTRHSDNPIIRPDPKCPWEQHLVTAAQIIKRKNDYLMFYIGFRDVHHAQIGIARSRDGITGWERHPENPIIRPSRNGWDADACYKPFAIFDGNRWLLWYNGRKGGVEQIGLAIHNGEDLGF